MSDLDRAVQALLERPLAPIPPIADVERRAHRIVRRRNATQAVVAAAVVVALVTGIVAVARSTGRNARVAASGWKTYDRHGLRFDYPPSWKLIDLSVHVTTSEASSSGVIGRCKTGSSCPPVSVSPTTQLTTDTVIPGVAVVSGKVSRNDLERALHDGRVPAGLVVFVVGENASGGELGPIGGGLGPERSRPGGGRARFGQVSDQLDMAAFAGAGSPAAIWTLVDDIARSVHAPQSVIRRASGQFDPSVFDKASANAKREVLHLTVADRFETSVYTLLVGSRCAAVRAVSTHTASTIPSQTGLSAYTCGEGWSRPASGTVQVVFNTFSPGPASFLVARVADDVVSLRAALASGTPVDAELAPDGWAMVNVPLGLAPPQIVTLTAYDGAGRPVATVSLRPGG